MKVLEGEVKDLKSQFDNFQQQVANMIGCKGIEVPPFLDAANPPTVSTVSGDVEIIWKSVPRVHRIAVEKLMIVMEWKIHEGEYLDKAEAEGIKGLMRKDGSLLATVLKLVHSDSKVGSGGIPTQPRNATKEARSRT